MRARKGHDRRKARPASPPCGLNSVDDGVRGRDAEAPPGNDRRQPRQPAGDEPSQSRGDRYQQCNDLNRDHEKDTAESHVAVLRFSRVDCSMKAVAHLLSQLEGDPILTFGRIIAARRCL